MKNPILEQIGNTPLEKIDGVYTKLEHLNPSGSIKDRMAKYIVERAERSGKLKKGYTIVEASSGNTGIAFSMVAALKGYKMKVVIPEGLSRERTQIIKGYGAQIINVPQDCFTCAIDKVESMGKRKNVFLPRQFANPWNAEENEKILAKEILKQVKKVDAVVAGVGTGGTIIGVGRALKKKFSKVKVFALEPSECHLLSSSGIGKIYHGGEDMKNICSHHGIEGIGDGIIPDIVRDNAEIIDDVITVKSEAAIKKAKDLAKRGYFVGPSSGANYLGAQKLKKKYKNVLTFFCDRGSRYLSEGVYD